MAIMRKKIAEHMVMSVQTSPHVYSAFEVDFSRVDELRQQEKAAYEAAGTKLTYTAFIAKATVDTIRECPFANASVDGDNVVYKRDINLGIAVALDQGLIVPVIRHADRLSLLELSRAIQDLAERARTKQLKLDEVQGGTFTITIPAFSARCSACRSSASRRSRFLASAASTSAPWSSTTPSSSGRCAT